MALRCSVCFEFFDTAMMVTKCSHNYCSLCIRRYLSYRPECPSCRESTTEQGLTNNRVLDELVKLFTSIRSKLLSNIQKTNSDNIKDSSDDAGRQQSELANTCSKPAISSRPRGIASFCQTSKPIPENAKRDTRQSKKSEHKATQKKPRDSDSDSEVIVCDSDDSWSPGNSGEGDDDYDDADFVPEYARKRQDSGRRDNRTHNPMKGKHKMKKLMQSHKDSESNQGVMTEEDTDPASLGREECETVKQTHIEIQSRNENSCTSQENKETINSLQVTEKFRPNSPVSPHQEDQEGSSTSPVFEKAPSLPNLESRFTSSLQRSGLGSPSSSSSSGSPSVGSPSTPSHTNVPSTSEDESRQAVTPAPPGKVACPVCTVWVPQRHINLHLDRCLSGASTKDTLRSRRKPLPRFVYTLMSDKDIRKKLAEVGLPTQGDRHTMIKKHQEFTLMYNAQCDSLNPKSAAEIVQDMLRASKQKSLVAVGGAPTQKLKVEKGASWKQVEDAQKSYIKTHKSQFSQLIAAARQSMKAKHSASVPPPPSLGDTPCEDDTGSQTTASISSDTRDKDSSGVKVKEIDAGTCDDSSVDETTISDCSPESNKENRSATGARASIIVTELAVNSCETDNEQNVANKNQQTPLRHIDVDRSRAACKDAVISNCQDVLISHSSHLTAAEPCQTHSAAETHVDTAELKPSAATVERKESCMTKSSTSTSLVSEDLFMADDTRDTMEPSSSTKGGSGNASMPAVPTLKWFPFDENSNQEKEKKLSQFSNDLPLTQTSRASSPCDSFAGSESMGLPPIARHEDFEEITPVHREPSPALSKQVSKLKKRPRESNTSTNEGLATQATPDSMGEDQVAPSSSDSRPTKRARRSKRAAEESATDLLTSEAGNSSGVATRRSTRSQKKST